MIATDERIRPCQGTCGRMTRTTKMRAKDHSGTVSRCNGTHCGKCWDEHLETVGVVPTRKAKPQADKADREAVRRSREVQAAQTRAEFERARRARIAKRMVRPVRMGQSEVRI